MDNYTTISFKNSTTMTIIANLLSLLLLALSHQQYQQ